MIVFDLRCTSGDHRFEGWFASSADFSAQQAKGLLCCPQCGSVAIEKAPMAPAVPKKGNQLPAASGSKPVVGGALPPQVQQVMAKLAELQAEALSKSTWVGDAFAEQSRAMHYGEREVETIHGQATAEDAQALLEEGIAVMPLPFPVAPPDELN